MKTRINKIKSVRLSIVALVIIIILIPFFLHFNKIELMLPVFTPLIAFLAFLGQQEQLNIQKKDSYRYRVEGTFFQLIDFHSQNVKDLIYSINQTDYQGRKFLNMAYEDLMIMYIEEKQQMNDASLKVAMAKLDDKYSNNLHFYFKSVFQVFDWVYEHREQLSEKQITSYVKLIRSQLSLNEMMLLYMNVTYTGRGYFYKILDELQFFKMYNVDGFGSIEERFHFEAEKFVYQNKVGMQETTSSIPYTFSKNELIHAIDNKEIEVYFQPIIDTENEIIIAAEGLLRWREGVNPSKLIEQFEHHGLTYLIFKHILHEICLRIKQSKNSIVFSMNLSVHQILLSDFLIEVEQACEKHKIDPQYLQFEITENEQLFSRQQIKQNLQSLRDKGHVVGIDDFGSGYFSFYDFVDLPIDFVKLDKQIVRKLDEEPSHKKSVRLMIELAKAQGLHVTVEGIETVTQYKIWQDMNIDTVQGFYFSEAVNFNQFKKLTKSNIIMKV